MTDQPFAFIEQLRRLRPRSAAELGGLVAGPLTPDPDNLNPYYEMYDSAAHGDVPAIEARLPVSPSAPEARLMLILSYDPPAALHSADVRARYGEPSNFLPPPPGDGDGPTYWVYQQGDDQLSFGFPPDGDELVSVVLDLKPRR
jgi:hypothetical protein